jgi:hypothetical protein
METCCCSYGSNDIVVRVAVPSESRALDISVVVRTGNKTVTGTPSNEGKFLVPEPSGCYSIEEASIKV